MFNTPYKMSVITGLVSLELQTFKLLLSLFYALLIHTLQLDLQLKRIADAAPIWGNCYDDDDDSYFLWLGFVRDTHNFFFLFFFSFIFWWKLLIYRHIVTKAEYFLPFGEYYASFNNCYILWLTIPMMTEK